MNREIIGAVIEGMIAALLDLSTLWPLALAALVLLILWLVIKNKPRRPRRPKRSLYDEGEWGVQDYDRWQLARDNGYITAPGPRPEEKPERRRSPHAGQWVAIAFIVAGVIVAGGGNYGGGIGLMVIGGAIAQNIPEED